MVSSLEGNRINYVVAHIRTGAIVVGQLIIHHCYSVEVENEDEFLRVKVQKAIVNGLEGFCVSIMVPEHACSDEANSIIDQRLKDVRRKTRSDVIAAFHSLVDFLRMIPHMNESFAAGAA